MEDVFISLTVIMAVAAIAPFISTIVPHNLLPESVILVAGGVLIGESGLSIAHMSEPVSLVRELGMGFLFLMAGFEVDLHGMRGRSGKLAAGSWFLSALAALSVVELLPGISVFSLQGIALSIAMTATALGTLIPILRDRGMLDSKVGKTIVNHGTIGELFPILAMAVLLGVGGTVVNALVLLGFLAVTVLLAMIPLRVRAAGQKIVRMIHLGAQTTAQTTVRLTVVLLLGLITLAAVFNLDVVLGAFAAGFILRQIVPLGRKELEEKLDGIGYGFFIPVFFVTTGVTLDVHAVAKDPAFVVLFVVLLMVVRGIPVAFSAYLELDSKPLTRLRQALRIACYASTSLPMIVAVTQLAVGRGVMDSSFASMLVVAGACSVLIMPLLGSLLDSRADKEKAATTKVRLAEQKEYEAREALAETRELMREAALARLEAAHVDVDSLDEETRETALRQRSELEAARVHADELIAERAQRLAELYPGLDWRDLATHMRKEGATFIREFNKRLQAMEEEVGNEEGMTLPEIGTLARQAHDEAANAAGGEATSAHSGEPADEQSK